MSRSSHEFDLFLTYLYLFSNKCAKYKLRICQVHQYSYNFLFGTFQSLYKQNKLTSYVWILKSSHFPVFQPKQHLFQEILYIFTRYNYSFSTSQNNILFRNTSCTKTFNFRKSPKKFQKVSNPAKKKRCFPDVFLMCHLILLQAGILQT
jgi:hypothetical protein